VRLGVLKNTVLFFTLLLLLSASHAFADMAAIHAGALPQETPVLAALDDAKQLEPYSHSWVRVWNFPVAKEEVATRLGKDLGILTQALQNHPDNAELMLLTGLVARYAYNFDVPGSQETAISVLGQAQKRAPSDMRSSWFHATLLCQTSGAQSKIGAEEFLSIEGRYAWDQLPVAFWDDYMECPMIAGLPAHTLRAADHLTKLHTPGSERRSALTESARKSFDPFDPKKEYEPKEVWQGTKIGDDTDPVFTSTTCGVRLRVRGNWKISRIAVTNGSCIIVFSTSSYQGTVHQLIPNVALLVKQPEGNETLQEFSKKYQRGGAIETFAPVRCPAAECIAVTNVRPEMYGEDGGGHGRWIFFERDQPDFPGLIFEGPQELPKADGGEEKTFYYRPGQTQQRIPGKLYYVVLLDTAASIEEPALKDFDFFLQNLTVE
jgi:hypothetical protein